MTINKKLLFVFQIYLFFFFFFWLQNDFVEHIVETQCRRYVLINCFVDAIDYNTKTSRVQNRSSFSWLGQTRISQTLRHLHNPFIDQMFNTVFYTILITRLNEFDRKHLYFVSRVDEGIRRIIRDTSVPLHLTIMSLRRQNVPSPWTR